MVCLDKEYLDKGYIGCFDMADKAQGEAQLAAYVKQLTDAGHQRIIAPINGDTWHAYRLVSWTNGDAAFPLEPQNPLWYNEVYQAQGFTLLMKYRSDKFAIDNVTPMDMGDVRIRGFGLADLPLIYDMSRIGFDGNFLYSDIAYHDFSKLYQPMLPFLDGALAVVAEVDGAPAGFIFSYLAARRLVPKTMAVLPDFRNRGVGAKLINAVLLAAREKGVKTAIAALMSEGNHSHKIVDKYGSEKIREYTLYSLDVTTRGAS